MDNKAYEQYKAAQPVVSRPERVEPEPLPTLTLVEIAVFTVFVILVVYAVYHIIRNINRPK